MPDTQSINQNTSSDALPNFRSVGVALRALLIVNAVGLLESFFLAASWRDIAQNMVYFSALLQPVLLLSLVLLYLLNGKLARLTYTQGFGAVVLLVMLVTLAVYHLGAALYVSTTTPGYFPSLRNALVSATLTALLLVYFKSRAQVLSPALHQARLQALQARIRPHFLFNTINAVLGIVRSDPKRAETALEDMADLFRMAMANNRDLVPLRQEISLAKQYLALEQLRLGERLKLNWQLRELPDDVLIPPLILQPLLENAVYHGIEPLTAGGTIDINLYRNGKVIHIEVRNPCQPQGHRHAGNKIALTNIRERLALQFDVEAHYEVDVGKDFYSVRIMLPYSREGKI